MIELPTVLIVEDEVLIQSVIEDSLVDGGFHAKLTISGEEAIKLLEHKPAEFRALATDINLGNGKLTGWEVARRARELIPDFPVVYMTGDSAAEWSAQGVPKSILLQKPFAPAQLVTAIAQLLNQTAPSETS